MLLSSVAGLRASVLQSLPRVLDERGLAPGPLLRRCGFSEEVAAWNHLFVTEAQAVTLLEQSSRLLGDPAIGLAIGRRNMMDLGPVASAFLGGETLRVAIERAIQLVPKIRRGVEFRLEEQGNTAAIVQRFLVRPPAEIHHLSESAFVMLVSLFRQRLGESWAPRLLRLTHASAPARKTMEEVLRIPIVIAAAPPALVFYRAALDLPAPKNGAGTRETAAPAPETPDDFEDWAEPDLVAATRRIAQGMVEMQDPGVDRAARTLGLSRRTLQWHLGRAGLTFSDILDLARQNLARNLLVSGHRSVTEIGSYLGYSDSANFTRAFRRWFGMTPSEYRRRGAAARPPRAAA